MARRGGRLVLFILIVLIKSEKETEIDPEELEVFFDIFRSLDSSRSYTLFPLNSLRIFDLLIKRTPPLGWRGVFEN